MDKAERKAKARDAMSRPVVNRTLPAPAPSTPGSAKKIRGVLAAVVGGLALAGGTIVSHRLFRTSTSERTLGVVKLDDGATLSLEEITTSERGRDTETDTQQKVRTETLSYRLRLLDAATGKETASRDVDGAPDCVAAAGGRAWCRWDREGHVFLVHPGLAIAGPVADRTQAPSLEIDREGGLVIVGKDGRPARVDPRDWTVKAPAR